MAGNPGNGSERGARSGTQTLALLAAPLNSAILRALSAGARQLTDLQSEVGLPAQTTLRAQLKRLVEAETVVKRRHNLFPGVLDYELNDAGRGLLHVIAILERWLGRHPPTPLALGESAAKAAVKALVEGWATGMLRVLAARPLALTDLDGLIAAHNYPALERRLGAMRLAGLAQARAPRGRSTPYALTDWAREGIAPLAAASHWEQRHGTDPSGVGRVDVETAFLLAIPLLRLPYEISGSCRMSVELSSGNGGSPAGASVRFDKGRVALCTTKPLESPDAWALGSPRAWLIAVLERDPDRLELGGDRALARRIIDALHAGSRPAETGHEPLTLDAEPTIREDGSN